MKTVEELYEEYFIDIFYNGVWETFRDFDKNDIIAILDQEEFTPEMVDELYKLVLQDQQRIQVEELEENTAELTDYLDRCIEDYDKYMTNSAIVTALIRCANRYL